MALGTRSYTGGRFALVLDHSNKIAGYLKKVEGGDLKADVMLEKIGGDGLAAKHISGPQYTEFGVTVGFSMSPGFYDWIEQSWHNNYARKNGSVLALDSNSKVVKQSEFFNAIITEVTMPALDASSKEACYMTIKFQPEWIKYKRADLHAVQGEFPKEQKQWSTSNFRMTLDGVNCTRVMKIDAFTVKQAKVTNSIGSARQASIEPGSVEIPNLKITLAEQDADDLYKWAEDFIIEGNCGREHEKTGLIEYLDSTMKNVLGHVSLQGVGINGFTRSASDASDDKIRTVSFDLHVEGMKFVATPGKTVKV